MLKLYLDNPDNQRITDVSDDTDDDAVQYEIEHLVNHKVINGKDFYLVRWKGYDQDEDTWEPVSNLEETAGEMIAKYHKNLWEILWLRILLLMIVICFWFTELW